MKCLLLSGLVLLLIACSGTGGPRPSQPAEDYERLLAGSLKANYVGNDNCLAKCHAHDQIYQDFQRSVHGEQLVAETGLPLINCESCHGAGSLAIADAELTGQCRTEEFLPLASLPPQAQSLLCLKCHLSAATSRLTDWNTSSHARSGLSCFSCHQLHQGPTQKVSRQQIAALCQGCHQSVRAGDSSSSRHPAHQQKLTCTDCHDPHGTSREHETTIKPSCVR